MSHLATPQIKQSPQNKTQLENFKKAKELFLKNGFQMNWFHIGGTYALLNNLTGGCNLVRIGKALYGVTGQENSYVKPVLKMTSKIVQIKEIKTGDQVGYDGTFKARRNMKVGVLPFGYNDGLDRRLSNKGVVLIDRVECRILGLISMNVTTVDLTNVKKPFIGQEVVIFSDNPRDKNSVINTTRLCNTIAYDILARLEESTKRVVI
jgi:alanine racemase